MATKLRKLKITRVAVCEQGANPDADILLFKSVKPPAVLEDEPQPPREDVSPATKNLSSMHAEPDGDEATPLDYATRSRQQDLWCCLWDKWERFCCTFYDICGDCDEDNIPHLPILVESIGQFQADIASLLTELGIVEKVAPAFTDLSAVSKAGATMAGHRLTRLKAAIEALQAIFQECTPPEIEHDGISAAEAAGIPGAVNGRVPGLTSMPVAMGKEGEPMAEKEPVVVAGTVAQEQLDALQKRAEAAEARVKELEPQLASLDAELAVLKDEQAVAKMSPEEQRDRRLAEMSPLLRKDYLEKEEELAFLKKSNQLLAETNERQSYIAKTADFRNVGMVPDDHWAILKAIDTMPEEPREELLRLLKAANEQLRAGALFESRGLDARPAGGGNGSGTAESQIMALAQAHATEKGIPLGDAIGVIAKQHPDLWTKDGQEKRFTNRVNSR